jgi:tRNA 5-methylaminomethyl-2-thiouridine biosynthesis bifunctional protein
VRKYPAITPAVIDGGHPHQSGTFGDYYFSITDPIGERNAIFIDGNHLKKRFSQLASTQIFRIGETGFGTGLTFLIAYAAFLENAPPSARLQWISTERYPLTKNDLQQALNALPLSNELSKLAAMLLVDWPMCIPTCHRRLFHHGRIVLDLHFSDATHVFEDLSGSVDAWCLDGFSPDRNPDLWTDELFRAIAAHSHHDTTVSTFSAARTVRDGLTSHGFRVNKVPGFGGKRDRLEATFSNQHRSNVWAPKAHTAAIDRIAIIGGGLSGAWTARALANRGLHVEVFEQQTLASGASGNPQGITYAKLSIEATPNSLIQLQGLAHLTPWFQHFSENVWQQTGVLLLAQNDKERLHQDKLLGALPNHASFLASVSRTEASGLAGQPLRTGGLHLIPGGWLNPKRCVETVLEHPLISVKLYHQIQSVIDNDKSIQLKISHSDQSVTNHDFDLIIWANALEASRFIPMTIPLKPVRGQITHIRNTVDIQMPICGDAYLAPSWNGVMTCGATYTPNSDDLQACPTDDQLNIAAINNMMDRDRFTNDDILSHRVSIRTATPDYAPVIGQLAEPTIWSHLLDRLRLDASYQPQMPLPFMRGQYLLGGLGSRGTLTAPIISEILASQILGEVLPVSETTRHALAPDRFFRRQLIRGLN